MNAANDKPAILGGTPVRTEPFPRWPVVGEEERKAVLDVVDSGHFSTFAASRGPYFLGGVKIREFERRFAEYHDMPFAIAVNSATAGLHASLAAIGAGPGDEIIVPPFTFTATATSVLMHNAVPVFADVRRETWNIDPDDVRKKITPRTKAIIPVHLNGFPADMDALLEIAAEHGLKIVEDCAQAPGSRHRGRLMGTMGDLGVFSFQETKNLMTGEGGMVVTRDEALADRVRMVRNHGEEVVEGKSREYISNMIGWNYRMTELEAAIGIAQFEKFDRLTEERIVLANRLKEKLAPFSAAIRPLEVPDHVKHVQHVFAANYNAAGAGMKRAVFLEAVRAEGVPVDGGYPRPLYMNPIFQNKLGYGLQGCPFACPFYEGEAKYDKGICPTVEWLCEEGAFRCHVARPPSTFDDIDDIAAAIEKVLGAADALNARAAQEAKA